MKKVANYHDEPVYEYTIENKVLKINVLNFGGTISGIYFKEDDTNMVASFQNKQDYIDQGGPYLNALVGPIAGRIAYGAYEINSVTHQLSINNGVHHLHGGASGVSKKLFDITQTSDTSLHLHLETSHAEDGYPNGTYVYDIDYVLNDHDFTIHYHGTPPTTSLFNMTNHLYFNLGGMKEDITHHILQIPSTKKCRIEKECHPSMIEPIIKDQAFDFSSPTEIAHHLNIGDPEFENTKYYDTPFLLDDGHIILQDPKTSHQLDILTDQSSVVVYSANWFDEHQIFEGGMKGHALCCLALETQDIPNGINIKGCHHHQIYDEHHPYTQTTTYRFTKIR